MAKSNGEASGWVGWVAFASFMLMLAGFFHFFAGFVSLFKDDVLLLTNNSVWLFDASAWGWIHIVGGLLTIWAASSLLKGSMWARVFAIIVAMVSAIANMAFVPVYPIWSLMIVAVDILVIYAVAVHGGELKN